MALAKLQPRPETQVPVVSRFNMPDLLKRANWLVERLGTRFPHLNERSLIGFLRGCLESNDFNFVQTRNAVGLAQITRRPLDVQPIVEEVFVLTYGDAIGEGAAIYDEFRRWASVIGATEVIVDRFTDVPRETIKNTLGRLLSRETIFVKVALR